jgi:hypothetical protein
MERIKQIEDYVHTRADLVYGKNPTNPGDAHRKEEYIRQLIKKNMKGGRLGETTATHSHHGFQIQSVLVPKDKFTRENAIKYVRKHFQYKKIDSTQRRNFYSFRQFDPTKNSKYFTKILDNGVELVFEKKPIGPDSIKPHPFEKRADPKSDRTQSSDARGFTPLTPSDPYAMGAMAGGSFKVSDIYKFIKNGYFKPSDRENITGYKLLDELSTKHFQVYQNKQQKIIVINYTGTMELVDWLNNWNYLFRTYNLSTRYKRAKDILEKVLKDYSGYQIRLISHSQSGIIVRELAKVYENEIFEIISLNPANLSVNEDKPAPVNEYVIKSDLDFASYFRKPEKNDLIIKSETKNLITEHLPEILFRLNPDLEIGRRDRA